MKRLMAGMVGLLVWVALSAQAVDVIRLTTAEVAAKGATHMVVFKYSDFTESSTNTAQAFTNNFAVAAKMGVECVGAMLTTAFDTGNTNYTGSVLLKIGDGSDDDLYLTSTELASDGTEVYLKFAPPNSVGATTAYTTRVLTNLVHNGGALTQNVTVVTGVTGAATVTVGELGRKLYTASDFIDFTFTPNANEALDDNTSGEVRVFFRVWDAR